MKQNSQSIQGLRPGGRFVTTAVSGEPIQADPVSMLFKQTSIIGSAHNDPGDITDILHLVGQGKVKLWLETYPIEDLNRVLTRLEEGKVRHRAVVVQA
jgi:D-arabinose 1-dehydrogenase-like Zn-dependent alcohol dehydrogenase